MKVNPTNMKEAHDELLSILKRKMLTTATLSKSPWKNMVSSRLLSGWKIRWGA